MPSTPALIACLVAVAAPLAGATDLDGFRWHHRLILVDPEGPVEAVVAQLEARATGIAERDVLWFVLGSDGGRSNLVPAPPALFTEVRARIGAAPGVVLIGKDGGDKHRSDQLDLDDLFARIDAMPMRRREMRGGD